MRKLKLTILLLITVVSLKAQNVADLDYLYKAIQDLPSYKDQLKDDKNYQHLYLRLRDEIGSSNDFEAFQKLAELISPIRDNHLGFYRKPDSNFKFIPVKTQVDLALLEKTYLNYPVDSIAGIYLNGSSRYVVYPAPKNAFNLVDLANGDLKVILYPNHYGSFDAIQFLKSPYSYTLNRGIKLENNILIGTSYYKGLAKKFYTLATRKKNYEYKILDSETGYLSLGSFGSSDNTIKEATEFFNDVKSTITVKYLIVDVRNNGGGGYKNSGQFLTFLNKFPGKIYILQNGFTVSNAEQFILRLREKDNVITLGETTRGMITYGSNYGKKVVLPSDRFLFYPTDMNGSKKELAFEGIGVKPDVNLNPFTEDWIVQTLEYIKAKK